MKIVLAFQLKDFWLKTWLKNLKVWAKSFDLKCVLLKRGMRNYKWPYKSSASRSLYRSAQSHCVCDGLALVDGVQPVGWLCRRGNAKCVPIAVCAIIHCAHFIRTSSAIGRVSVRWRIDGDTNCRGLKIVMPNCLDCSSVSLALSGTMSAKKNLHLTKNKAIRCPHFVNLHLTNVELVIFLFVFWKDSFPSL